MANQPAADHRSGPALTTPTMGVHAASGTEVTVDGVKSGDHLVDGGDGHIDDRVGNNNRRSGHIVVVAVEPVFALSRLVFGQVDKTINSRFKQSGGDIRHLPRFRWPGPARVSAGS